MVLTGQISIGAHPWLADHAMAGMVVFPGAGLVELAIRAGDEVGCAVVHELMLRAPMVIPAGEAMSVQVVVGAPDESGQRAVSVYSRGSKRDSEWLLHAEGILGVQTREPAAGLSVWPPAGAVAVDVRNVYEEFAARGYQYGPAFRGLRAIWRRGQEVFAEVALTQDSAIERGGFGIHPALLDAALHAWLLASEKIQTELPFAWEQVSLYATGATHARVCIGAVDGDSAAISLQMADVAGLPLLSACKVTSRPISRQQLAASIIPTSADERRPRIQHRIAFAGSPAREPGTDMPSDDERRAKFADIIRTSVAVALGYPSSHDLDANTPLQDLGVDSVAMVLLSRQLTAVTGCHQSPTARFQHSTIAELVDGLIDK